MEPQAQGSCGFFLIAYNLSLKPRFKDININTDLIQLNIDEQTKKLTVLDRGDNTRILIAETLDMFRPCIDGKNVCHNFRKVEWLNEKECELIYNCEGLNNYVIKIKANSDDSIDFSCRFVSGKDCQLNKFEIFPQQSLLNCYYLINFRNRHYAEKTWPEFTLGGSFKTDTFSGDWQFAPHPAMFIFTKCDINVFFGAFDMPDSFGMYIDVEKNGIKSWYIDYGNYPNGMFLKAGKEYASPRYRLFVRKNQTVYETLDEYSSMLIKHNLIPDPKKKVRYAWWKNHTYCTWIDQTYQSKIEVPAELQEQANSAQMKTCAEQVDENLVRKAVSIIKKEKLPLKTIILDDGWAKARGQWEPHKARFPNFRKLVDDLHKDGFKVVVWWNWAEIEDPAAVIKEHLFNEGKPNKHGKRLRDYSNPATQEEYLKPLFYKLFSGDKGCYDIDGVKTDFLADKIRPEMHAMNPDWRGEERYFYNITRLFYEEMRKHKSDSIHIGGAGNFRLAEYIDVNRTYDVWTSNYMEHRNRGLMLRHSAPGCPVAYDFHIFTENLKGYLQSAKEFDAGVHVGNVIYIRDDAFSQYRVADSKYYEVLRENLKTE
ncbi:MAG: hypothetical protein A2Y10_13370 [Planctomycetes bacterium GWF2_41_51]|nr:MAG: hypothetical protein A2Y10_13370 [Planctomycetes bacterium GWF2_41_51]HBG26276.1 hypothetical protein [Phycisphaerales bacterium]